MSDSDSQSSDQSSALQKLKESALTIATIGAVTYGIGWLAESIMQDYIGLGHLEISHQQATSAGLTFLLMLSPVLITFWFARSTEFRNHSLTMLAFFWVSAIGWAVIIRNPSPDALQVEYMSERSQSCLLAFLLTFSFTVLRQIRSVKHLSQLEKCDFSNDDTYTRCLTIGSTVLWFAVFSVGFLPTYTESFGGLGKHHVFITLKNETKTIGAILVASDEKSLVFWPDNPAKKSQFSNLVRLHWDDIKIIEKSEDGLFDSNNNIVDGHPAKLPKARNIP